MCHSDYFYCAFLFFLGAMVTICCDSKNGSSSLLKKKNLYLCFTVECKSNGFRSTKRLSTWWQFSFLVQLFIKIRSSMIDLKWYQLTCFLSAAPLKANPLTWDFFFKLIFTKFPSVFLVGLVQDENNTSVKHKNVWQLLKCLLGLEQ